MTRETSRDIGSAVQRWYRVHWASPFRADEYREALLDLLAVSRARTLRELLDTIEFGLGGIHDAFRQKELALDDYLRQVREAIEGLGTRGSRVFFCVPLSAPIDDPLEWQLGGEDKLRIFNSDPSNAATNLNLSPEHEEAWETFWTSVGRGQCSSPVLLGGETDGGEVPDSLHRLLEELLGSLFALDLASWYPRTASTEWTGSAGFGGHLTRPLFSPEVPYRLGTDPIALAAQVTAAFVANWFSHTGFESPIVSIGRLYLSGGFLEPRFASIIPFLSVPSKPLPEMTLQGNTFASDDASSSENAVDVVRALFTAPLSTSLPLRGACRWLFRTTVAEDPALSMIYFGTCIEGLLIDTKETKELVGRLSEAVAHLLGRTAAEKVELRKIVKDSYKARSEAVHAGRFSAGNTVWAKSLRLASSVVRKELRLFSENSPPPRHLHPVR